MTRLRTETGQRSRQKMKPQSRNGRSIRTGMLTAKVANALLMLAVARLLFKRATLTSATHFGPQSRLQGMRAAKSIGSRDGLLNRATLTRM